MLFTCIHITRPPPPSLSYCLISINGPCSFSAARNVRDVIFLLFLSFSSITLDATIHADWNISIIRQYISACYHAYAYVECRYTQSGNLFWRRTVTLRPPICISLCTAIRTDLKFVFLLFVTHLLIDSFMIVIISIISIIIITIFKNYLSIELTTVTKLDHLLTDLYNFNCYDWNWILFWYFLFWNSYTNKLKLYLSIILISY